MSKFMTGLVYFSQSLYVNLSYFSSAAKSFEYFGVGNSSSLFRCHAYPKPGVGDSRPKFFCKPASTLVATSQLKYKESGL